MATYVSASAIILHETHVEHAGYMSRAEATSAMESYESVDLPGGSTPLRFSTPISTPKAAPVALIFAGYSPLRDGL